MKDDGGEAFPCMRERIGANTFRVITDGGMSLRDYFAAKAVAGARSGLLGPADLAAYAYAVADAMLTAREVGRRT